MIIFCNEIISIPNSFAKSAQEYCYEIKILALTLYMKKQNTFDDYK